MITFLKRADLVQTRLTEDARVRTERGGLLFLIAFLTSLVLASKSVINYLSQPLIEYTEHIEVDAELARRLYIELDMSFPHLSCLDIELVALDVSGEAQLDISSEISKVRLSPDGFILGDAFKGHVNRDKAALAEKMKSLETVKEECGSCYGAEYGPDDCCKTCHDVKVRYASRTWDTLRISREAIQCLREIDHPEIAVQPQEGCKIHGSINV